VEFAAELIVIGNTRSLIDKLMLGDVAHQVANGPPFRCCSRASAARGGPWTAKPLFSRRTRRSGAAGRSRKPAAACKCSKAQMPSAVLRVPWCATISLRSRRHRFFTHDIRIEEFVRELLGDELVTVRVRAASTCAANGSSIRCALGAVRLARARVRNPVGYAWASAARAATGVAGVAEDWVVAHFGARCSSFISATTAKRYGHRCRDISASGWRSRPGPVLGAAIRMRF